MLDGKVLTRRGCCSHTFRYIMTGFVNDVPSALVRLLVSQWVWVILTLA